MWINLILNSALLGFGLAMDAFSVSLTNGLSEPKMKLKKTFFIAGIFALFQALMPLLGYFLGAAFADFVSSVDHWITFILLGLIGGNMIKESLEKGDSCPVSPDFSFKTMLAMAVATSIDALAVGITFSFFEVNLLTAITVIGITTFALCTLGVLVGHKFGARFKNKASLAGGIVLILIGTKILLEHLGILVL